MFRRPTEPEKEEEEISADLLDSIPDMGAEASEAAVVQFKPVISPNEARVILSNVRREMEASFARELDHVEDAFARLLQQMQDKLDVANADLTAARIEQQRAKAEHDRKTEALRELKRTLDSL